MTGDRLPLAELLAKAGDADFLRTVAEAVAQPLMEDDVEGVTGGRPAREDGGAPDLQFWDSARSGRLGLVLIPA